MDKKTTIKLNNNTFEEGDGDSFEEQEAEEEQPNNITPTPEYINLELPNGLKLNLGSSCYTCFELTDKALQVINKLNINLKNGKASYID